MIDNKQLREMALLKLNETDANALNQRFPEEVSHRRLTHELMVHQIELEMQNEELLVTKEQTSIALNLYKELFEFAPISYCKVNEKSEILSINLHAASKLGMPRAELIGARLAAFLKDEYLPIFNAHLESNFTIKQTSDCELQLGNGSQMIWMQASFKMCKSGNECLISLTDINQAKAAEAERSLAATVFESLNEAAIVSNMENEIIAVNPSFSKLTGYASEDAQGLHCSTFLSCYHDDKFYKSMTSTLETTGRWEGEVQNTRRNGEEYTAWLTISSIYDANNVVSKRVALLTDITEKKRINEIIAKQANFDPLTGLANRNLFQKRLLQCLNDAKSNQSQCALLSIDLDQFKDINDSLGHQIGDQLLIDASERLIKCAGKTGKLSRIGGDEFAVILENIESFDCTNEMADKILHSLSVPFYLGDNIGYISASIGIAIYPDDSLNAEALIINADQAMYAAKRDGRNRMRYFTSEMQDQVQKRLSLSSELRHAIDNKEFWLAYQPIVNLKTGGIDKAESLLRWEHPVRGSIPPMEFIPIAEESEQISTIGDWVFKTASKQTSQWLKTLHPNFQISINMSPSQFRGDNSNHAHWTAYLDEINLKGKNVVIEITESLLMDVSRRVMTQLDGFHAAGIEISLDDFGTGYSSLAYLKKFHIDYLKIDKSFVKNLEQDPDNIALCEAIIVLAHRLGLKVIAEGIETSQQRDLLRDINCDYGQGYLFSEPLSAQAFERFVVHHQSLLQK